MAPMRSISVRITDQTRRALALKAEIEHREPTEMARMILEEVLAPEVRLVPPDPEPTPRPPGPKVFPKAKERPAPEPVSEPPVDRDALLAQARQTLESAESKVGLPLLRREVQPRPK